MKLYITIAYRYGNTESHHYIESVHSTLRKANKAAKDHVECRDGKYDIVVWKLEAGQIPVPMYTFRGLGYRDKLKGLFLYNEG